jgi:predicted kinase
MLRHGRNVVIEFGSWTRAERDALRESARDVGAAVELRYVTAPVDELVQRLADRGADTRFGSRMVDAAEIEAWAALFEAPTPGELAEYDPPADFPM